VHGGTNYDVCYNNTFTSTTEIIWSKLENPEPGLVGKGGLTMHDMYKLEKPLPAGDYLVKLQTQGPNGWPSWQIVTRAHIKALR